MKAGAVLEFVRAEYPQPASFGSRPYQLLPSWLAVCSRSLGVEFVHYRIRRGPEDVGEFTFAIFKSGVFGKRLISMPFSDGGGLHLYPGQNAGPGLAAALAGFLDAQASARGLDYAELRGDVPWDAVAGEGCFETRFPYVSFILDLVPGYAATRRRYGGNVIKNLRKADKCVDVEPCEAGAMPAGLYRIYLAQMRQFGSPPLPAAYFSGLLGCGLARIYVGRVRGRVAGFLMVLVRGSRMLAEINASLGEFDSCFPKVRLFDHAIRAACQEGLAEFDFMRTRKNSGVYRHKKNWGGTEKPIAYHFRARDGRMPGIIDPDQGRYFLPRLVFKALPLRVSAYFGPGIRARIGK